MARIRVSKKIDSKHEEMVFLDLDVTYLIGTILGNIPSQSFQKLTHLGYPFTITIELATGEKEINLVTDGDDLEEPI